MRRDLTCAAADGIIAQEAVWANEIADMLDATTTRLMYTSTDRNDTQIAVTGQLVVPNKAWSGSGARPLIAYAVGPGLAPGHVGGAFGFHPYALSFLDARFRGDPPTSTCATI